MENILKQINSTRLTITLTLDEAQMLRHYIDKSREEEGLPTNNKIVNKCPICNGHFAKSDRYCPNCGQRVRFIESDDIPL